jgi:hypothetical protein
MNHFVRGQQQCLGIVGSGAIAVLRLIEPLLTDSAIPLQDNRQCPVGVNSSIR